MPQGSLYPALHRLEKRGWLKSEWEDIDPAEEGRAVTLLDRNGRFKARVVGATGVVAAGSDGQYSLIDEYSLASRLSYFLWSTMPDEIVLATASPKNAPRRFVTAASKMA